MESLRTLAFYSATATDTASGFSILQSACVKEDYEAVTNILTFSPSDVDSLVALSILERNLPSNYKGITPREILKPRCSSLIKKLEASLAIYVAAREGTANHIRWLVENGANVNDLARAAPPLHFAAEFNSLDVVKELVSCGADLSAQNNIGLTAAQVAAWAGKTETLLYLMDRTDLKPFTSRSIDLWSLNYDQVDSGQVYLNYLHLAIWGKHQNTVAALIEVGYDINECCECWPWLSCVLPKGFLNYSTLRHTNRSHFNVVMRITPLMLSALTGDMEIFLELIKNGAKFRYDRIEPYQKTLLSFAVEGGSPDIVKYILENSNQINESPIQNDPTGITLLHLVRGESVAKMLIDFGLDVNADTRDNFTPLQNAAEQGDIDLTKLLIAHGADIRMTVFNQMSLLAVADMYVLGDRRSTDVFETTKYFIDQGLDVNAKDKLGRTALHFAALCRATGRIKLLLNAGADVNIVDREGQTALHYACVCYYRGCAAEDNPATALLLLENGINHLATTTVGDTALHVAAYMQLPLTMERLLEYDNKYRNASTDCSALLKPLKMGRMPNSIEGSDLTRVVSTVCRPIASPLVLAVNHDGQTALHEACRHPDTGPRPAFDQRTVELLLRHRVDTQLKDNWGKKAIDYALFNNYFTAQEAIKAWDKFP